MCPSLLLIISWTIICTKFPFVRFCKAVLQVVQQSRRSASFSSAAKTANVECTVRHVTARFVHTFTVCGPGTQQHAAAALTACAVKMWNRSTAPPHRKPYITQYVPCNTTLTSKSLNLKRTCRSLPASTNRGPSRRLCEQANYLPAEPASQHTTSAEDAGCSQHSCSLLHTTASTHMRCTPHTPGSRPTDDKPEDASPAEAKPSCCAPHHARHNTPASSTLSYKPLHLTQQEQKQSCKQYEAVLLTACPRNRQGVLARA